MKKKLLLLFFIAAIFKSSSAQITGSDTVCAGYLYTFNASIAGADSFVWSYPAPWAVINGQGTSQIQLLCTQSDGQICVDAYDTNGLFIGQYCDTVYWGGGGVSLSVQLINGICPCTNLGIEVNITPGTSCPGCGTGSSSPYQLFGIYDGPWPSGNYLCPADSVPCFGWPSTNTTFYVYLIDTTFGVNNALLIEGGACPSAANNSIFVSGPCFPPPMHLEISNPYPCPGDTVLIYFADVWPALTTFFWSSILGGTYISDQYNDSVYCVVNNLGWFSVTLQGTDYLNCYYSEEIYFNSYLCSTPISGDSVVCSDSTYNYYATLAGAVDYLWTLPSGWYNLTGQGTSSISVTCDLNDGPLCVEGFDNNLVSVGVQCITTQLGICSAQISGDTVVCTGYTYNYNVNIPGAVTYNWTLPPGWYGLTGQGTSSISAICNVNTGNICAEGFDSNSVSLGTQCINTQWGNGGAAGWDIYPPSFYYCSGQDRPVHFMIIPDTTGSGSCPGGCGSGTQIPNLIYGLYDSSIPYPQFIAEVDGSWITMPPVIATYQVFYVDVSAGYNFPDAVNISGGCGAAGINNTVTSNEVTPWPPTFIQSPDPACIGDTVLITQTNNLITNISWSVFGGTILSYPDTEQILIVITSGNPTISYDGFDESYFCNTTGGFPLNMCSNPSAAFNALSNPICPGTCTDFNNLSFSATSYEWIFPGANPSSSTAVNPTNICYNNPGTYEVTLIASNSQGSDTLTVPYCITVYPYPPSQSITQLEDTLAANQGFISYQWYFNGNIIPGATDYFYVAGQSGDYNLISVDSNGCEVEAVYTGFMMDVRYIGGNNWSIFPNPVKENLVIKNLPFSEGVSVSVYDIIGKYISGLQYEAGENLQDSKLNVSSLVPGIYFIEVSSVEKIWRIKFIRE